MIREAYDKLREARYPLTLPFDLWLETVRQFCNYFETPLARVLEVLRPNEDLFALIQSSTNIGNATVSVANADAWKFKNGITCTYFIVSANRLSGESKRISAIGAPDSGGAGQTTITLVGVWTTAPNAGDRLVSHPLENSAGNLYGIARALAYRSGDLYRRRSLANDKWHELYGFPSVRTAIQNPTNAGNATFSVSQCRCGETQSRDLPIPTLMSSANVLSAESKIISPRSALPTLAGRVRQPSHLTGVWTTAPDAGDLLVCDVPAMLKSAKALSRRLGVTYKEIADIVQTGFVNPELGKLALLYKLDVGVRDAKLYKDEKAFYEANKDLLGKDRSTLSTPDQQRFDDLAKKRPNSEITGWQVVNEVAAFEQRLTDLARHSSPR